MDSDEEQALLEELIEDVKPPTGAPAPPSSLTLFRYPPLRMLLLRHAPKRIWYLARRPPVRGEAYYLLLFLEGTTAELAPLETDVSIFQAAYEGQCVTSPAGRSYRTRP